MLIIRICESVCLPTFTLLNVALATILPKAKLFNGVNFFLLFHFRPLFKSRQVDPLEIRN